MGSRLHRRLAEECERTRRATEKRAPPPVRPFFLTPILAWLHWNLKFYEGPRDWQNVFALTRFRYIAIRFHIFYYNWGKENRSLFWGLLEACFLGRIYTGEANLIKNKGEETLQCSLKWGKRTQGWTGMILKFINDSKLASGRNITNYNTMNEHDTERRLLTKTNSAVYKWVTLDWITIGHETVTTLQILIKSHLFSDWFPIHIHLTRRKSPKFASIRKRRIRNPVSLYCNCKHHQFFQFSTEDYSNIYGSR